MKGKRFSIVGLFLLVLSIPQWVKGQNVPLTAKEAVLRTDPVAKQWANDAALIFVGTVTGVDPSGRDLVWACGYYSAAKDSTYNFYAAGVGPISFESTPKEGYPSLEPIGMDWQDSNVAGRRAEQLGGGLFRAKYSDTIVAASVTHETIFKHTPNPLWGFWWTFTYYSAANSIFIKLHFAAKSLKPAPKSTVTHHEPSQNQDIAFTSSGNDTLAVLNFSSGTLDSIQIEVYEGYLPDTTATEKIMQKYYTITSYPANAPFEATLTLFYDQADFDASGMQDEAGLKLYRYHGQRWELVGGTADPQQNSVTATGITEFSKWAFSNPNEQPLKVDENGSSYPENFVLWQNYPNPFNPETVIDYQLPRASEVQISIFNLQGQKVATLVRGHRTPGSHKVIWNGRDEFGQLVASGVYLYQLKSGSFVVVKKMLLLR